MGNTVYMCICAGQPMYNYQSVFLSIYSVFFRYIDCKLVTISAFDIKHPATAWALNFELHAEHASRI